MQTHFFDIVILFFAGCTGGILAGLLGIGGGVVYVFILSIFLKDIQSDDIVKYLVSNSAFAVFFAGIAGSIKQYKNNNFYLKEVLFTAIPGIISSLFLSYLIINFDWYSKEKFAIFFVLTLIILALRMFNFNKKEKIEKEQLPLSKFSISGFVAGIFLAMSGLGGGVAMVPLLSGIMKLKIKKVTSISLGAMPFFALSVSLFYAFANTNPQNATVDSIGFIVPSVILPIIAGVIISSPIGVMLSKKIADRYIKLIFAIVLLIVIVRLLIFNQ
ncbi:MAG: sulfite exporter TauE/SafE family protein [Bacteroidota bacterium]|nr:sulfite exporter TauE/SafE family protein [Bacteroidota bacterium]